MNLEIPKEVLPEFLDAGWSASRRVPPPPELVVSVGADHPGVHLLTALSGLHVGGTGAGEECARSDIEFGWPGPEDNDEIAWWEQALGTRLVCIGEVHHGHGALYVASDARCFGLSLVHDLFAFEGDSIATALVRLIRGRRSKPMLRADQTTVMMYGDDYTRDSAEVYWPRPDDGQATI